jgi:protein-disulfide isomerase
MKWLLVICFALITATTQAAQFGPAQYKIVSDYGDAITNFDLRPDLASRLIALAGQVPVGNAQGGDVTLYQLYDLNCPFCREAAADVDAIVRADKKLKLVFVPYAVLSIQSVQGALIELAVAKMLGADKFLDFHRRIYAQRGMIDGARALAAAKDLGLDPQKVAAEANTEATLNVLRTTATFGTDANLVATPAYVIGNVVILGHPGRKALQKTIASMRQCGKVVC